MIIWFLIIICGIFTFLTRFIALSSIMPKELPPLIKEAIKYVPIAVLTPIVITTTLINDKQKIQILDNPKLYAVIVAIFIAIITRSMITTILVGLSFIWLYEYFIN